MLRLAEGLGGKRFDITWIVIRAHQTEEHSTHHIDGGFDACLLNGSMCFAHNPSTTPPSGFCQLLDSRGPTPLPCFFSFFAGDLPATSGQPPATGATLFCYTGDWLGIHLISSPACGGWEGRLYLHCCQWSSAKLRTEVSSPLILCRKETDLLLVRSYPVQLTGLVLHCLGLRMATSTRIARTSD